MVNVVEVVGAVLLSSIFIWAGIVWKPFHLSGEAARLGAKKWPVPLLFILASVVVDVGGAGALIWNSISPFDAIAPICVVLAGYSLLTALVFHDYWNHTGIKRVEELASFLKNVAIVGALLIVGFH